MKKTILISYILMSCLFFEQILSTNIVVNSTDDFSAMDPSKGPEARDGKVTLRSALEYANHPHNDCDNIISFNIPGQEYHAICLDAPLPVIVKQIFIDGYTQEKSLMANKMNPVELMIEINGEHAGLNANGLTLSKASDSVIRGLVINNFSKNGISIEESDRIIVTGNYIGVDPQGFVAQPNEANGIYMKACNDCTIGGSEPSLSNLISGNQANGINMFNCQRNKILRNFIGTDSLGTEAIANGSYGIQIIGGVSNCIGNGTECAGNVVSGNNLSGIILKECTNTEVFGNYIGTDTNGTKNIGNKGSGIELDLCHRNYIGGKSELERNIISANLHSGVNISQSTDNVVIGNYIGTDASGNINLPNKQNGIEVTNRSINNKIGGQTEAERNVISGNGESGISIQSSFETTIEGNYIGIDSTGQLGLPNELDGISLKNSRKTCIGGPAPASNVIAFNNGFGVQIESGNNNLILTNSIYNNKNPWAIQFIGNGNNDQPTPKLYSKDSRNLLGSLKSFPNEKFVIQFFNSDNNAEIKEGKSFIGEIVVQTDSNGHANFEFPVNTGYYINCTATRITTKETSRFSNTIEIEQPVKGVDLDTENSAIVEQNQQIIEQLNPKTSVQENSKIDPQLTTNSQPNVSKPENNVSENNIQQSLKPETTNKSDANGNLSNLIKRKYKIA